MKTCNWLMGFMLGATTLLSACGGGAGSGEIVFPQSVREFATSLITLITGSSCDTATPTDVNGLKLPEDDQAVDANTLPVNCNS